MQTPIRPTCLEARFRHPNSRGHALSRESSRELECQHNPPHHQAGEKHKTLKDDDDDARESVASPLLINIVFIINSTSFPSSQNTPK